jgi:aldose 1-epimerase
MQSFIENFGSVHGQKVHLITLINQNNQKIQITNYGGIVHAWFCNDNKNQSHDILLGCPDLDCYLRRHPYFGAIVGRYANRIAYGKFAVNQTEYQLNCNLPPHHLHGGVCGFDTKVWDFDVQLSGTNGVITLSAESQDMEEGYPGHLHVLVSYTFTEDNELIMSYEAMSDRPTIINLTNHCYFNLSGDGEADILDHDAMIMSDTITETDENLIPTGKLLNIRDTYLDLRGFRKLHEGVKSDFQEIRKAHGYDHNYVLSSPDRDKPVAIVRHLPSGRRLQVFTDQPGLQLYTGNWLHGVDGKSGKYKEYAGFCLETQHFPDSPNHASFPSTLLVPGQKYATTSKYKIDIID